MGVFNQNCFISGKSISRKEPALVIVLEPSKYKSHKKNFDYVARSLPIVGNYDEYGCVDLKNLEDQKFLIKSLNKSLSKVKDRMGYVHKPLTEGMEVNWLWSTIHDYDQPVCYLSKKIYDLLPSLTMTKKEVDAMKAEMVEFRKSEERHVKMIEEYKKTKDKDEKELLKALISLHDSPIFLQGKMLGRMTAGENYYIGYAALKDAILTNRDEEVISFYALTETMRRLGKTFQCATYGSQESNKKFVINLNEAILKALK